jgi:hypothetical protein
MLYTLIAYKENSVDTCRGCVMDAYGSAFEAWSGTEAERLAEHWAMLRERNRTMGRGESGYAFLLFIDGVPAPNSDVVEGDKDAKARDALWERQEDLTPAFDHIRELTDSKVAAQNRLREEAAAQAAHKALLAKEEAARKAAIAKEAAERAEFERLATKFGRIA